MFSRLPTFKKIDRCYKQTRHNSRLERRKKNSLIVYLVHRKKIEHQSVSNMYSVMTHYSSKFCQYILMKQILKTACTNSKIPFYKNFATLPGRVKELSSCDHSTIISNSKVQKPNFIQNAFRCLLSMTGIGMLRNRVSIRKYLSSKKVKNNFSNSKDQQYRPACRPSGAILRNRPSIPSNLCASNVRTFTTASSHAANYDFPINPIPMKTKSVQQLRKTIPHTPIAQNYMPFALTETKTQSEKVYRKIRNSCKSLVSDLMYSFPFNTHSERAKEVVVPKFDIGGAQNNSINSIIDKLSPKPRHSIWSITDSFSFPNIHRRLEIEELVPSKETDGTEEIPSIANI